MLRRGNLDATDIGEILKLSLLSKVVVGSFLC